MEERQLNRVDSYMPEPQVSILPIQTHEGNANNNPVGLPCVSIVDNLNIIANNLSIVGVQNHRVVSLVHGIAN